MSTQHLTKQEFARLLGMGYRTYQRRMKELNLNKMPRGLLSPTIQNFIKEKLEELELKKLANFQQSLGAN
jgi:hypothetical protein